MLSLVPFGRSGSRGSKHSALRGLVYVPRGRCCPHRPGHCRCDCDGAVIAHEEPPPTPPGADARSDTQNAAERYARAKRRPTCSSKSVLRSRNVERTTRMRAKRAFNAIGCGLILKWMATRLAPKKYGDRVSHDVQGNTTLDFQPAEFRCTRSREWCSSRRRWR